MVHAFAPLVERLEPLQRFSPFYHYIGNDPLRNGVAAGHVAAMVGVTVALLALALVTFNRRDVMV